MNAKNARVVFTVRSCVLIVKLISIRLNQDVKNVILYAAIEKKPMSCLIAEAQMKAKYVSSVLINVAIVKPINIETLLNARNAVPPYVDPQI